MSSLGNVFEGSWNQVEGQIKNQWGKLTDSDLKQIDGSFEELVGRLKKRYGYETLEIESQVAQFLQDNDINVHSLKNELIDRAEEMKEAVKECMTDYLNKVKASSGDVEEKVISYCKENPFKSMAIAGVVGYVLSGLLRK